MIYTQLFDSEACRTQADCDAAEELLKLNVLTKDKPRLPFGLVTDSPLLLSAKCAGNYAFRELIRQGHLQFPAWVNASTLAKAFILQMKNEKFRFCDWWPPQIRKNPGLRKAAIDHLERGWRAPQELEEMLDYIRALSSDIQCAPAVERERDSRPFMKARMNLLKAELVDRFAQTHDQAETDRYMAEYAMVRYLPDDDAILQSRSRLYDWRDGLQSSLGPKCIAILTEMIDKEWNKPLAELNGYPNRHTIHRNSDGPGSLTPTEDAQRCTIEQVTGDSFAPELFSEISWYHILEAMKQPDARPELARKYAQRRIDSETIVLSTAATRTATSGVLLASAAIYLGAPILVATGVLATCMAGLKFMTDMEIQTLPAKQRILERTVKEKIDGYVCMSKHP